MYPARTKAIKPKQPRIDRRQSREATRKLFKLLKGVDDGDIILVKNGSVTRDQIKKVADALSQTGRPSCLLIAVQSLDDVRTLSEAEMNALGWQKLPTPVEGEVKDADSQ